MRMEQVELAALHCASGHIGSGAAKRGEAPPVVLPVMPGAVGIGLALALEQRGGIEDEPVARGQQPGRCAHQVGPLVDRLGSVQRTHHRRIAGQERGQRRPVRRKRSGQRAGHVGQPTGLDQWHCLGRDREHGQGRWIAHP